MRIDDPGGTGGGYHPLPKPKPKPKPRPVAVAPRPASRPPGVAAPYKPKQKGTSPLKPANFSTITASARSRVGNTYGPPKPPGALNFAPPAQPAYGPATPRYAIGPWEGPKGYNPGLFQPAKFGPWDKETTAILNEMGYYGVNDTQAKQGKPGTQKGGGRSGGGSGYYPRAYYGGGSGGGGGGGGGSEFERYGMTKDWMQAYKAFWGHALPREFWGMFSPVQELFSRYQSRLPQLDDWQRIWQAAKDYQVGAGKDAKNMPKNLALYEPWIAQGVRPPLFTPPAVSYAPFLSF